MNRMGVGVTWVQAQSSPGAGLDLTRVGDLPNMRERKDKAGTEGELMIMDRGAGTDRARAAVGRGSDKAGVRELEPSWGGVAQEMDWKQTVG